MKVYNIKWAYSPHQVSHTTSSHQVLGNSHLSPSLTLLASSCLIFSSQELYIKMYHYMTHDLLLALVSGLFFLSP